MYFNKGLYFQNLRLEFLELKISQAFGVKCRGNGFIFVLTQEHVQTCLLLDKLHNGTNKLRKKTALIIQNNSRAVFLFLKFYILKIKFTLENRS